MAIRKRLDAYLVPGKHIHLIGIGGVSMRPLGLVLRGMGMIVTGSDMNSSVSTDELISKGIEVHIGHNAENIEGADCIIRTAAAHNDNPEIAAARALGIPVFERAQAWGVIMREYKNAICISGTHGKTTTTSMITHIFMEAQRDPTVMLGGYLPLLNAGHRVGSGDTIIMESCEYCDSFLNFYPTVAIVNNIEADHLDYFKDLEAVERSFRKFAGLVPRTGYVIANGDDRNTVDTLADLHYISFGLDQKNDIHPEKLSEDMRSFDVVCYGKHYCHVHLNVYGKHNVYNALAAAAAAYVMGVEGEAVSLGLASFTGAGRRMEHKGTYHGAEVYDDYAHHPGELKSLIDAVRTMGFKRIILAFQPHTYTRTKALFDDFVEQLRRVDVAVLAEIYAARESNKTGISSADLAALIDGATFFETLPEVSAYLKSIAQEGDIILTVGAGDIYKAGEMLLK
ncbi:MAG: UDP-N-acetylmuramate--L-alanine ligase [Clostridiales bacterium]|nr:UDP-N-acetylmuramate--L-alanine ligase [Clostridiales bacterium]